MEQGVKYVLTLEDMATPGFWQAEERAMGLEGAIDGVNTSLRVMGGILAAREIFNFGKDIVETTTKLESYKNLVKFASANLYEATANQNEINKSVKDFKLPIMETYQEYSQLMAMVKGTPVEGEKARLMFHDLAQTLTVLHLPAERVQQAIASIGKLLEEGNLQPRYLRPLIANLPGFGVSLAHEMGISMQKLNEEIRKGHLTTTSSYKYIPGVLKDMKDAYAEHLPEALQSYQAQTNELKNTWLEFKEDIGNKLKPEIIGLFHSIEEGVDWMKAHEDDLIAWGKVAVKIGEGIIIWKGAQLALNLVQGATNILFTTGAAKAVTQISTTQTLTASIIELTTALEALNVAQTEATVSATTLYDAHGMEIIGSTASANSAFALTEGVTTGAALSGMEGGAGAAGATLVSVVGVSAAIIAAFALAFGKDNSGRAWHYDKRLSPEANEADRKAYEESKVTIGKILFGSDRKKESDVMHPGGHEIDERGFEKYKAQYNRQNPLGNGYFPFPFTEMQINDSLKDLSANKKVGGAEGHISSNTDKITGQRVVTYNIKIGEINGIKENHTTTVGENVTRVADEVQRLLLAVVNDSQIRSDE